MVESGIAPRLLGLAGQKFSGKDTFARLLIEEGERRGLRVVRVAFADKLKVSAARSLGFTGSNEALVATMDALKEVGTLTIRFGDEPDGQDVRGRHYLQMYGTEAHRDVFGPDFWVDACLPVSAGGGLAGYGAADLVVVSDCRFVNEAERIKALGGRILEMARELPDDGDTHTSETPLPREYVYGYVPNNGTIEQLAGEAALWVSKLLLFGEAA